MSHEHMIQQQIARVRRNEEGYKAFETDYVMTDEQQAEMCKSLRLDKDKDYRPYCVAERCG